VGQRRVDVPGLVAPQAQLPAAVGYLRGLGLRPGDRVVTALPNDATTLVLSLAAMLDGIVQVPLPIDLGPTEVADVVADADPTVVLAHPSARGFGDLQVPVTPATGDLLSDAPSADPAGAWPRTRPMAYTSGTTGRRKGVHVGVHDDDWGRAVVDDEHAAFDRRHGDRHLVVSPLYHSGPLRFAAVTALTGGRVAVLPHFDPRLLRDALRTLRPTSLFCVPTHLHRLLALDDLSRADLSSVRLLAHAGAPCPVPLKERVLDLAPEGSVWEFYGSTEGQFTVCPPEVWSAAPGSVGTARPGRSLAVRDDDRVPVAPGGTGTVWVQAPQHARWTYWRSPDRTADAWDSDAFTVGDLGHLDGAGRLFLDGRPGDLVISGGVNVYPAEVERFLLADPTVAEAVVFGVPDDDWGERVVAAVVAQPGQRPDPGALRDACRRALAAAKVPKQIRVVDELPRTPTGKVRRVGLAAAVWGRQ
jgi:long-chain acyl-CoA synthetase